MLPRPKTKRQTDVSRADMTKMFVVQHHLQLYQERVFFFPAATQLSVVTCARCIPKAKTFPPPRWLSLTIHKQRRVERVLLEAARRRTFSAQSIHRFVHSTYLLIDHNEDRPWSDRQRKQDARCWLHAGWRAHAQTGSRAHGLAQGTGRQNHQQTPSHF